MSASDRKINRNVVKGKGDRRIFPIYRGLNGRYCENRYQDGIYGFGGYDRKLKCPPGLLLRGMKAHGEGLDYSPALFCMGLYTARQINLPLRCCGTIL